MFGDGCWLMGIKYQASDLGTAGSYSHLQASDAKHPSPTSDLVFDVERVSFYYQGRFPALLDVSLQIRAGQRVAILGANGSGKSTLLKILDGLYFPSEGVVRAFGRELTATSLEDEEVNWAFRRRVGLVFQDPDVQLFSPTVWDEVAFGPLQLGLSRQEVASRVEAALALLRIEGLAERVPYGLSGGEKKKVALASVLVLEPEVLLMDEPTAALDPRSQRALVDSILELSAAGRTIVTATHDLDIVAEIADHVFVFGEERRLVRAGSPKEILGDHDLLEANNLAHSHRHVHAAADRGEVHNHPHLHHDLHGHQ